MGSDRFGSDREARRKRLRDSDDSERIASMGDRRRSPSPRLRGQGNPQRSRSRSQTRRRSASPGDSRYRPRSRDRRRDRDNSRDNERDRGGRRHRERRSKYHDEHGEPSGVSSAEEASRRPQQGAHGAEHEPASGRRGNPLPSQADSFAVVLGNEPEKPKDQPNFKTTGALAAASNAVTQADGSTISLKYHEPPEARKPPVSDQWKLFVFKGKDVVDTISLGDRSCWLVGRDAAVVDLLAEHPSISKQHAVLQFRYVEKRDEFGDKLGKVKPYLLDLDSVNGTRLNKDKVPGRRYLELMHTDVVQFGHSTRDYVLMLA